MTADKAISDLAEKLLGYLDSAELMAKKEVPEFVTQFLVFKTWETQWEFYLWLAFLVILIALQAATAVAYCKVSSANHDGREFKGMAPWIFILLGAVGMFVTCAAFSTYAKIKKIEMAPKVYIVEQIKGMTK